MELTLSFDNIRDLWIVKDGETVVLVERTYTGAEAGMFRLAKEQGLWS